MRRTAALLALAAGLLAVPAAGTAFACAQLEGEPPRPCCQSNLVEVTAGDQTVGVPDPFQRPWICS